MARDPFAELRAGEKLAGLPHAPWNRMLRDQKRKPLAAGDGRPDTSVEIRVQNKTAAPVGRFAILKAETPVITFAADANEFFSRDLMRGETPAAGSAFVVTLQPLSVDEIGPARLMGLCRCEVNLTDTAHKFADCTTATDKLTSGGSGQARVLWVQSDSPGPRTTGDQWAAVILLGQRAGTGGMIQFSLPSALATTDASKAACTVDAYWGGPNPGSTVTVYNMPASSNYVFSGASGHKGYAAYDDVLGHWRIIQMECP